MLSKSLMTTADLSHSQAQEVLCMVASSASPKLHSAAHIFHSRMSNVSFLPLRLAKIDRLLGGGLSRGSISEVVGPAGVGKTQLCLTLTAVAGLARSLGGLGEGTGVLYFDTEGKFSAQRLVEIAQAQSPSWFGNGSGKGCAINTSYSQSQGRGPPSRSSSGLDLERSELTGGERISTPPDGNGLATARVVELLERTHVCNVENSEDFLV
jgi:RecA/RadA recombinase